MKEIMLKRSITNNSIKICNLVQIICYYDLLENHYLNKNYFMLSSFRNMDFNLPF